MQPERSRESPKPSGDQSHEPTESHPRPEQPDCGSQQFFHRPCVARDPAPGCRRTSWGTGIRCLQGWTACSPGGQKPLGYAAGDANFYRYVGNSPTRTTDPAGLIPARPKDETLKDIEKQEYAADHLLQILDLEIVLYKLRIGLLNSLLEQTLELRNDAKPLKNKPLLNAIDSLGSDLVNDLATSQALVKNLKEARMPTWRPSVSPKSIPRRRRKPEIKPKPHSSEPMIITTRTRRPAIPTRSISWTTESGSSSQENETSPNSQHCESQAGAISKAPCEESADENGYARK